MNRRDFLRRTMTGTMGVVSCSIPLGTFAADAGGSAEDAGLSAPKIMRADVYTEVPERFRYKGVVTEWAMSNRRMPIDSSLEGLTIDRHGNMYVVDVPFGRIFRISPSKEWTQIAHYDGEPNGMAMHADGKLYIADYRKGLLTLDPATGKIDSLLGRRDTESFKGLNDLIFSKTGDIYFTDQGQTGLQDPSGRVYRLRANGQLDTLLSDGVSPNGLALTAKEDVLYVAMTRDNAVWRLPLFDDGTTGKVGRFISFSGPGGPDSMSIDRHDNLVVALVGAGSVYVINPDGEILARILSPRGKGTTNPKFGGADRTTLFITESVSGSILSAPWSIPGPLLYSDSKFA
jgi:gluconolactonase